MTCQGRLTLQSGVPVSGVDQIGKTVAYWTPFRGDQVELWDGSSWILKNFVEMSIPIPIGTTFPHDVFLYLAGGSGIAWELQTWANNTSRAVDLGWKNGRRVKGNDPTRRYASSLRPSFADGRCEDSVTARYLSNYDHPRPRELFVQESLSQWSNNSPSWRFVNGNASNSLNFLVGTSEYEVEAVHSLKAYTGVTGGVYPQASIGLDGATSPIAGASIGSFGGTLGTCFSHFKKPVPIGYHYLSALESVVDGNATFFGGSYQKFSATVWG